MTRVTRWPGLLAAFALAAPLAAVPAQAQLQVAVTPNDLDEDDQHCFMHGTLSTQTIDVTNAGAAPALATLHCSVPGQALRTAAISPPETIAPGATARLYCSLYDYQDPPDVGAVVSFDVDVNGQVSSHDVTLRCRKTPLPAERCAAARLSATAATCREQLAAFADHAAGGGDAALEAALARSSDSLATRLARIEEKADGACRATGALDPVLSALAELGGQAAGRAGTLEPGACAAGALDALARKCRGDLRAWSRFARGGDSDELERSLAQSDAGFEKRYARALRADGCTSGGERDWLRLSVDDAVAALARGEDLDVAERPAELLRAGVRFAAGEREKRLWVPMPGAGALLFDRAGDLHAVAFDATGLPVAVAGELASPGEPEAAALELPGPAGHVPLRLRRSGSLRRPRTVTALLDFDDPAADLAGGLGFFSPLRTFPAGEDVHEVPAGAAYPDFDAYVLGEWGYPLSFGLDAVEWLTLQPLFYGLCPAGGPGATPPPGSSHDRNECGISTFIHSMESQFPGALAPDVTTDPKKWDDVAEKIGHRNWHGTPFLADNVNETFSGAKTEVTRVGPVVTGTKKVPQPSRTRDGKFYCGDRIADESPANLAAWGEDCDLKVLIFDLPTFGHWADVNSVTPDPNDPAKASLELQDYEKSYDVACTHTPGLALDQTEVDFSADPAAAGSVMQKNFDADDPVAGDEAEESVSFWVVCECDRTDPLEPKLPAQTKSGKTLNP